MKLKVGGGGARRDVDDWERVQSELGYLFSVIYFKKQLDILVQTNPILDTSTQIGGALA